MNKNKPIQITSVTHTDEIGDSTTGKVAYFDYGAAFYFLSAYPAQLKVRAISLQTDKFDTFEVLGCSGRAWVEEKDKDSNGGVFDVPRWTMIDNR